MKRLLALLCGLLALTALSTAQNFNLSKFTNASGLPQNYAYSIIQDDNGYIWIGMAEGLSRYDGLRFTNYSVRDSLASNYVSKMIIDTDGVLWCGHGNGSFSYYNGQRFCKLEGTEEMESPIKDMCLDDKGNIWAVEQNMGLVKISPDKKMTTYFDEEKFGSRQYTSVCAVNSLMLLVGTSDGLMTVKVNVDGTLQDPEEVEELSEAGVNCIRPMRHGKMFWVCQDDGGIYRYSPINGSSRLNRCTKVCATEDATYDIRSIFEDVNGDIYIGTYGEGLKEWKYRAEDDQYVEVLTLNEENGLGNNYVTDIVMDREGIFWFATYGGGVVAWINNYFAQYNMQEIGLTRSKVTSSQIHGKRLWLGLSSGIVNMDVDCMANFEYYDESFGVPMNTEISCFAFDDKNATQYVGTARNGIYYRGYDDRRFRRLYLGDLQENEESINGLAVDDTHLYAATKGGLIVYNTQTQRSRIYTTLDQLPHNNINFVYIDPEGQVWIGPKDNMIANMVNDSTFEKHRLAADMLIDVTGMTIDERGRKWLATANNGVLCYQDSIVPITTADGLEKNYCYGLAKDQNGHIWVCHKPGLSCIDLNNGNIHTYNQNNGFNQEFGSVTSGGDGDLWFTSSGGVVRYIGEFDKRNSAAPVMNMTNIVISGKRHNMSKPIDLGYPYRGDADKLEFSFVGIYMKDPHNVTYEYWLQKDKDDKDAHWMPLGTQNHKEFDYLPSGDYILNIRAFNSAGIVSQRVLQVAIHIDYPFWRMAWFPFVAVFALLALVGLFAKWREQKLRERQQELEAEVARQTKEINEKKNEIEAKNKDITGSINYANRIQTAVLPSRNSLKDFPFADSFLYFRPRDIVSGDFYWFNRYGDHVLICCGDCTGHGVPGAFMTLIGTTILNDATRDPEMRTPARLLEVLDKEVKSTLNKNQAIETRDGMDISIIDIDMATGIMISASAKRPIFVVRKRQLTTIKGTRRAIGDVWNDNEFLETKTQLAEGDCIYMCSDGYADQLGSDQPGVTITDDNARKFSTKRFTQMLETISDEPMEEQHKKLQETFENWRNNIDAVDDVIVMGIRFKPLDDK